MFCYFMMGCGLLTGWNAFLTATDFFNAVFPVSEAVKLHLGPPGIQYDSYHWRFWWQQACLPYQLTGDGGMHQHVHHALTPNASIKCAAVMYSWLCRLDSDGSSSRMQQMSRPPLRGMQPLPLFLW
jgi:hypothetical protein